MRAAEAVLKKGSYEQSMRLCEENSKKVEQKFTDKMKDNNVRLIANESVPKIIINDNIFFLNTNTHPFNGPFFGTTQVSRTRKVKPIWILLKQGTVSGSGISWAICKSAPRSRQITTPAPHHSSFFTGRMHFLTPNQQRKSTELHGNFKP